MNSGTIAGLTSAPLKTKGWNNLQKTVTSSGTVSWKSGLGAISQILGPTDQDLKINIPTFYKPQQTGSWIGKAISITGGAVSYLSPLTWSGSEVGGSVTISGGFSYQGGAVIIKGGDSGAIGGTITLAGGRANGGDVTIEGGLGSAYYSTGGSVTIKSGAPNFNVNSFPGNISISTSDGWDGSAGVNQKQSNGGIITISSGAGGGTVNGIPNGNGPIGANGGELKLLGGKGGNSTGTTVDTQTGGIGSVITITSGIGGSASGTGGGLRVGGKSGSITISTGQAGSGTNTNGDSGSITISTGLPGSVGTGGVSGSILFNTGSTNQITISPARTTITNEAKIERAAVIETSSTSIQLDVTNYAGMVINCTSSSAVTITLPTTNVPLGYNVVVIRSGTGTITFAEGTVTAGGAANVIRSYSGFKSIDSYSSASLICLKSGSSGVSAEYSLSGGLIA